jgi:Fur family transcriptional regulator, zinc uptake regulator
MAEAGEAGTIEATLDRAALACARRGAQLTDLRRQVLRLVLEVGQPLGAYALLDRLKATRAGAAPPTVYRALDFLLEQGLIHKVERLNAFVGCVEAPDQHGHGEAAQGGHHGPHGHPHQFLICRLCGATVEIADEAVEAALRQAAARLGFAVERATIEAEGRCASCAAAAAG